MTYTTQNNDTQFFHITILAMLFSNLKESCVLQLLLSRIVIGGNLNLRYQGYTIQLPVVLTVYVISHTSPMSLVYKCQATATPPHSRNVIRSELFGSNYHLFDYHVIYLQHTSHISTNCPSLHTLLSMPHTQPGYVQHYVKP